MFRHETVIYIRITQEWKVQIKGFDSVHRITILRQINFIKEMVTIFFCYMYLFKLFGGNFVLEGYESTSNLTLDSEVTQNFQRFGTKNRNTYHGLRWVHIFYQREHSRIWKHYIRIYNIFNAWKIIPTFIWWGTNFHGFRRCWCRTCCHSKCHNMDGQSRKHERDEAFKLERHVVWLKRMIEVNILK